MSSNGPSPSIPRHVLPVLVVAQFAGTSLWFAVNAVMPDLQRELGWAASAVGTLTSALQFGFIAGTLVFALLAIADRFAARAVFLACALAGAACTVGAWWTVRDFHALLLWRFATGFFLAGIYPVGMKIAAQWYSKGLGAAMGLLIGALVLGSASAHALRALGSALPWPSLMLGVAALAARGCRRMQRTKVACCCTRRWATRRTRWRASARCNGAPWAPCGRMRACALRCWATSATCGSFTPCG